MIGFLSGTVQFNDLDAVCINVGGVGYRLLMPLSDLAKLSTLGARADVYVHTHAREDALVLFGFSTHASLRLFERLIAVTGLGPKTALALLSGVEPDVLKRAIAEGDEARLTKIPGVGKKTAARIILELRERFAKESLGSPVGDGHKDALDDLRSALANLGYKTPQIDRALQKLKPQLEAKASLADLVREALRHVTGP
jgi:holliday junction DNA helicase RuvA